MNTNSLVNYNTGFPNAVSRSQFNSYFNPGQGVSTSTNNIIWVQGIEGAKAWQLAPSSMVILLDSEVEGKMYIKVTDNIGMGTLRVFNYAEEALPSPANVSVNQDLDLSAFVRKDELSTLIKEVLTNEQSVPVPAAPAEPAASPKVTYLKTK